MDYIYKHIYNILGLRTVKTKTAFFAACIVIILTLISLNNNEQGINFLSINSRNLKENNEIVSITEINLNNLYWFGNATSSIKFTGNWKSKINIKDFENEDGKIKLNYNMQYSSQFNQYTLICNFVILDGQYRDSWYELQIAKNFTLDNLNEILDFDNKLIHLTNGIVTLYKGELFDRVSNILSNKEYLIFLRFNCFNF